ncbi:MAG: serine hydrolase domain-containing protein [Gemmatimonadaceae bacterium]
MLRNSSRFLTVALAMAALGAASTVSAQATLSPAIRATIDSAARAVLSRTGAPSASVAVVRDGQIVYTNAYGSAHLDPAMPATTSMRYSIGSVSKQFTATAVLLLAERHKLSLDDKLSRWLPDVTRANEITVRQILSMTSGIQDYWPQDYVMPTMLQPVTAAKIVAEWAHKPLDFAPGTKWQYSNTNYVIAGLIVEKASGMGLVDFLKKEIFTPLHMESVAIIDDGALGPSDPQRYLRYALGPPRVAPKEGKGWLFAAGELAMTPSDLAKWDISVIDKKILTPASYAIQQTNTLLKDGTGTGYGLGVDVGMLNGHRLVSHNGEVSGFTTQNSIFPDDRAAVVVVANLDATSAPSQIAAAIANAIFSSTDPATDRATKQAKAIFAGLQHGTIDRSLFTDNANAYFSNQAIEDFGSSLGPLGAACDVSQTGQSLRGGMTYRGFRIHCGAKNVALSTFTLPNGKLEQFQIASP